jgi:hypothetical protein
MPESKYVSLLHLSQVTVIDEIETIDEKQNMNFKKMKKII